jgi:transcriptional regulator with XRE-family HTH domain
MAQAIKIRESILKVIHAHGLTYKHLSAMSGIPASTMHQYLNGKIDLSGKRLDLILTALGFSLNHRDGGNTLMQQYKQKLPKSELDRIEAVVARRKQIAKKREAEAEAAQRHESARKKLLGAFRPKHVRTHELGDDDVPVAPENDFDPLE